MKLIHTADLHLGQVIYQNYDRADEHKHFFDQLESWCTTEHPDVLLVSGDVFDIQQPSALVKKTFTDYFVNLHRACPSMHIVITAGNHDSASRIQADSAVWEFANVHLVGMAPSADMQNAPDGWQDRYIVRLECGYIVALPFMTGERSNTIQSILDRVAAENQDGKPVVMMAHLAVTGMDATGHGFEIGKIKTVAACDMGHGYDYLALGHIHKPQTIDHQEDCMKDDVTYPSGVMRYSGSALHVSCDEQYPHTVSVVDINKHGGEVNIKQLRIDELRHFYVLPLDGSSYNDEDAALEGVKDFVEKNAKGYIRLRVDYTASLSANFNQMVYDMIASCDDEVRYNSKIIWTGAPETHAGDEQKTTFEVAELQQMTDPVDFIEKTMDQYAGLTLDDVRAAFEEVRDEIKRYEEEEMARAAEKEAKKAAKNNDQTEPSL